jgi:hypothetical protein
MTLHHALRNGWHLVSLNYDRAFALVERQRPDGLRERALALRISFDRLSVSPLDTTRPCDGHRRRGRVAVQSVITPAAASACDAAHVLGTSRSARALSL